MAVLLLALSLCAVEVWFRWERLASDHAESQSDKALTAIVIPSRTSWLDVAPLVDVSIPSNSEQSLNIRTNEFGLRGGDIVLPKPQGVFRVVCLGGAAVFGWDQPEEHTVPGELQSLFRQTGLNHVEFLNAGCPGSGLITNYLRVRNHLVALQPDLVLYCLTPEDLAHDDNVRGGVSLDSQGLPAFATHPTLDGTQSDDLNTLCREFATADWIIGRIAPVLGVSHGKTTHQKIATGEQYMHADAMVELWKLTQAHQCRLMISMIPNAWEKNREFGEVKSQNLAALERDLHNLFADHGIQSTSLIHNPQQIFQANSDLEQIFDSKTGQLKSVGNAFYARTIAKTMVDFFPDILTRNASPKEGVEPAPLKPIPPALKPPPNLETPPQTGPLTDEPFSSDGRIVR